MSTWPSNPAWTPGDNINNGDQYEPYDGVIASDINKIITNILYLYLNSASKEAIDAKLDKVISAGTSRCYAIDAMGKQTTCTYNSDAIKSALMYRSATGDCQIQDPVNPYSVANRRWVEAQIASALGTINTALEAI